MALTQWELDPAHSEISFKIKHLMISTVTGRFNKFNVISTTENDDFNTAQKIEFTADIDSIDTNNAQRDSHLKSADFFNIETHPQIHFAGTKYEVNGDEGVLIGDLTIAGVTKSIKLNVEYGGLMKDFYGNVKAGFTVTGKINRKDFGINYGAVTEAGGVLLGDEIKVEAEIQLIKKAEGEKTEAA